MRNLILKVAKCQDGSSFYKKFPTEEAFMAKHGVEFYEALEKEQNKKSKTVAQNGINNSDIGTQMFNDKQKQQHTSPNQYDDFFENALEYIPQIAQYAPHTKLGDVVRGLTSAASIDTFKTLFDGKNKKKSGSNVDLRGAAKNFDISSLPTATNFDPSSNYGGMDGIMSQQGTSIFGGSSENPENGDGGGFMKKLSVGGNFVNSMVNGWESLQAEKAQRRVSEQMKQTTGLAARAAASNTNVDMPDRRYNLPQVVTGNELYPVQGNDYSVLGQNGLIINAQDGREVYPEEHYDNYILYDENDVPNMQYGGNAGAGSVDGDIYGKIGQTINAGTDPLYGKNAGKDIGGAIGSTAGSFLGPAGQLVGEQIGRFAGWALDGNPRKIAKNYDATQANVEQIAGMNFGMHNRQQYGAVAQEGTTLDMYQEEDPSLESSIQTGQGGYVEKVAENPLLSGGGDIMRTYGNAHTNSGDPDDDGIDTQIQQPGQEPVNINTERGEVITGTPKGEIAVSGNLHVNPKVAAMLGITDPIALAFYEKNKNKKAKNISIDNAKQTKKVNSQETNFYKKIGSSEYKPSSLEEKTFEAMRTGFNMKYKNLAKETQYIVDYNERVNAVARESGLRADDLAKNKFTTDDGSFRPSNQTAQNGMSLPMYQHGASLPSPVSGYTPQKEGKKVSKTDIPKYEAEGYHRVGNTNTWVKKGKPPIVTPGRYETIAGSAGAVGTPTTKVIPATKGIKDNYNGKGGYMSNDKWAAFLKSPQGVKYIEKHQGTPEKIETIPAPVGVTSGNLERYIPGEVIDPTPDDEVYIEDNAVPEKGKKRQLPWPKYRPSSDTPFDYSQILGELSVMGRGVDPVFAQGYKPLLKVPHKISLQDKINAVNSMVRGAQRFAGYNPAAQAAIMGQAQDPLTSIYGDQFRINQEASDKVYNGNYDTLNDAALKNLQIYDTQADRMSRAKSNTDAEKLTALNSMTSKFAQHRLEDQEVEVGANMYPDYSFGDSGRIYKNPGKATWNMEGQGDQQLSRAEQMYQMEQALKAMKAEDRTSVKNGNVEEPTIPSKQNGGYAAQSLRKVPLTRLSKLY